MPESQNHRPRALARPRRVELGVAAVTSALLAACSGDVITLGEEHGTTPVPPHSRCQGSTTLEGPIKVEDQEQLDALEGCEVIAGDLEIVAFLGAHLRSLHALRQVEGDFALG